MTGAVWRSGLAAALFGLHPLHVESVAWISERKDVLSTFFFLLMLLAYLMYATADGVALPCRVRAFGSGADVQADAGDGALGAFAAGLLAAGPHDRGRGVALGASLGKVPLFALAGAAAAMTFVAQRGSGAMGMLGQNLSLVSRLENAVWAYGVYLEKAFWPHPLAVIYPYRVTK